jgi:hypothetical protein
MNDTFQLARTFHSRASISVAGELHPASMIDMQSNINAIDLKSVNRSIHGEHQPIKSLKIAGIVAQFAVFRTNFNRN